MKRRNLLLAAAGLAGAAPLVAVATAPSKAELGTIRGDYSLDSPVAANLNKRAMKNLIHASETPDEAVVEIAHWFSEDEIFDYNRTDHAAMF